MTHDTETRSPRHSSFPLSYHPEIFIPYPWREPYVANDPTDQNFTGKNQLADQLRSICEPANTVMPGCRTPVRSKGKRQTGAVSSGERSIEMQIYIYKTRMGTAATHDWLKPPSHHICRCGGPHWPGLQGRTESGSSPLSDELSSS